ncbi:hypothetical protein [uncultured Bacteroides sp.]|nr:hypothetical protein [uncultured Bacteroides sp.]
MKELNGNEVLSAEEMGNLKGGGQWVCVDGVWYWIETINLDSEEGKEE